MSLDCPLTIARSRRSIAAFRNRRNILPNATDRNSNRWMSLMAKKFPKSLYVKRMKDGEAEYFICDAVLLPLVEMGESETIATYQLIGVQECEGVVETRKPK